MCGPSGRFIAELDSGSPPHPYIFSSLPSPVFCQETPSSSRAAKQRLRSRVTGGGLCILKPRRLSNFIKVTCWVPAWGGGAGGRGEEHRPDVGLRSGKDLPVWAQDPQGSSPAVMHVKNTPISQSVLRDPGLPGEDTWLAATSKTDRHCCSSGTNCNLQSAASDGETGWDQRPVKYTKHGCSSQHTGNSSSLFKNCVVSS